MKHKQLTYDTSRRAFTIVELLIVIVVIAILAAISVAAYSGVRERAEYATISNLANTGLKALKLYKAKYGDYPSERSACFGTGYIDRLAEPDVDCVWDLSNDSTAIKEPTFDAKMAEFISSQPNIGSHEARLYTRWNYQGAWYWNNPFTSLDGIPHANWFWYTIPDFNGTCPVGEIVRYTWPDMTSDDSISNSQAMTVGARCLIPLN